MQIADPFLSDHNGSVNQQIRLLRQHALIGGDYSSETTTMRAAMADGARPHAWTDKRTHKQLGKVGHGCGSHHWRGCLQDDDQNEKDAQIIRV